MAVPRVRGEMASVTGRLRYRLSGRNATVSQGEHHGVGHESPILGRVRFTVGTEEQHQVEESEADEDARLFEGCGAQGRGTKACIGGQALNTLAAIYLYGMAWLAVGVVFGYLLGNSRD